MLRNGLGKVAMCPQCNIVRWLACRIADIDSAWGQGSVECISSVRHPAGADGGVIVDEALVLIGTIGVLLKS